LCGRHVEQAIHVAGQAVEMRRHDGSRPVGDHPFDRRRIQIERRGIDVSEHHLQPRDFRELWHHQNVSDGKMISDRGGRSSAFSM